MISVLFFFIVLYCTAIAWLIFGFSKIKNFEITGLKPKTNFTIIVPFRNEAKNLPLLLKSLSKMNYPTDLFEVILVDDESDDDWILEIADPRLQIIKNNRVSNSPKKDAITTAIPQVKTEWIITTDADCIVPENWLMTLNNHIQTHDVSMLAGAVKYSENDSFLHHFQQLDLASLQGATIGSFGIGKGFMCNGANLAYTKSLFEELNGFEGNNKIASGDDVFLLQKAIAAFPEKVHYLKSANTIISTKPLDNWKTLFYQRVRWASKTNSYQSSFGKIIGLIVFFGNLALIISIFTLNFWFLTLCFCAKFCIDAILISKTNSFLGIKTKSLLLGSILYPFFSTTVALYTLIGKYEWKGRNFSK